MKALALLTALALIPAPSVLAQRHTFVIDPKASEARITLNTTHEVVHGSFPIQSGSIDFDRDSSKMSGSVAVLAGSGKTGNGSRDKKMYKDILLVEQHATISFEPQSYSGALAASGDSTIQVSGVFTLLGTPHPITLPMAVHIAGTALTAKGNFNIPYVTWGLKNPSFLFWKAEDDVAVELAFSGTLSK